jgi:hypothetical protein
VRNNTTLINVIHIGISTKVVNPKVNTKGMGSMVVITLIFIAAKANAKLAVDA